MSYQHIYRWEVLRRDKKKIIIITAYESVQGLEMVQADVVQIDVVQKSRSK